MTPILFTLSWAIGTGVFIVLGSLLLGWFSRLTVRVAGHNRMYQSRTFAGYAFAAPWIIGFVLFVVGPALASLYWSFTRYEIPDAPEWVGFDNYVRLITRDDKFLMSLLNSLYMTVFGIPLQLAAALGLALLLNQRLRGERVFRMVYYLPVILATNVAMLMAWRLILNPSNGLLNQFLEWVAIFPPADWLIRLWIYAVELSSAAFSGIQRGNLVAFDQVLAAGFPGQDRVPLWLQSPLWSKPALILIAVWSGGQMMLIYLAALKGVPQRIYEAAAIDGAGAWARFRYITLPLITPSTFYNLVVGIIATLQIFEASYALTTNGGPSDSTYFVSYYLWRATFRFNQIGYGAAMSWLLLIIILVITGIQFWVSRRWVTYDLD